MNKSLNEIPKLLILECKYDYVLDRKRQQIHWYLGNTRLRNKHGQILIRQRIVQNLTTISRLKINTTNRHFKQQQQQQNNLYKCQYKGLFKTINIESHTKIEQNNQPSQKINSFYFIKPNLILFHLILFIIIII
jgi:hypothetical protein